MKPEKLQKNLAKTGIGSRREIERWIEDGRISINGRLAKLGDRADTSAKICLDDRLLNINLKNKINTQVLIYHKPIGELCTRSDPQKRNIIFTNLPSLSNGRWISVGRLDINTSGLLLLTNDGELANTLMHPSSKIEREYLVRVLGEVDDIILERLQKGIQLQDGMARFDGIYDLGGKGANHWYRVIIKRGRNREVRRLWEAQKIKISRLMRIRFGSIVLPKNLKPGCCRELSKREVNLLYQKTRKPKC